MKNIFVIGSFLTFLSFNSHAIELFQDEKPIEYIVGSALDSSATIGGYPIYPGVGWSLRKLTVSTNGASGEAIPVKMGTATLFQNEPDGSWFGTMYVTANLTSGRLDQYMTGAPCSGIFTVAVNKGYGRDDNCMTITAKSYQSGEKNYTYFSIRSRNAMSSGRFLGLEIQLNPHLLGFRDTTPVDWTEDNVNADPVKKNFMDKLRKWAESIQDASQHALAFNQPKNVYATIPSYRALLDVPPDLADGSYSQLFIGVVEHVRHLRGFKSIAYTKRGFQKIKWAYTDNKEDQLAADNRALEMCNTNLPSNAEPCKIYDINQSNIATQRPIALPTQ